MDTASHFFVNLYIAGKNGLSLRCAEFVNGP
jgi:hypothetical protein